MPAIGAYVLVGLLAVYHASLLGRGALAFGDEFMSFRGSLQIVDGLHRYDWTAAAAGTIGFWGARPAEFLIRAPAAAVQRLAESWTGLPPSSPSTLPLATAQNVVVAALLSLVFFRVTRRLIPDDRIAALATAAFALLATNHIWVRHLVPYDTALAAHLVALGLGLAIGRKEGVGWGSVGAWTLRATPALVVTALYPWLFYRYRFLGLPWASLVLASWGVFAWRLTRQSGGAWLPALRAGLMSGCALALYPAYYSFVPALGLIVVFSASASRPFWLGPGSLLNGLGFGAGVVIIVFAFEVLARLGNVSYLGAAALMPQTITQGTYEEGFVFLPKYLFATDGLAALFLLVAAALGVVALTKSWTSGTLTEADATLTRVTVVLGALYLVYGFQSVVLHRMNFSGRYARMYIPVFVWLAALAVIRLPGRRLRRCAAAAWLACAAAGFAGFALDYARIDYPADVLFDAGIGYEDLDPRHIAHESEIIPNYNLPVKEVTAGARYVTQPGDQRFHLVNFGFFSIDGRPLGPFHAPSGYSLMMTARHFLSSPSAVFEGFAVDRRDELLAAGYRLQIWCRNDACPISQRAARATR